jgi:transmembrane sensor
MDKAQKILEKYNAGTGTAEERACVESWYLKFETPESDLTSEQIQEEFDMGLVALSTSVGRPAKTRSLWPQIAAAASVLLTLFGGGYMLLHRSAKPQVVAANHKQDIAPGTNGAILILANGKKVVLEQTKAGVMIQQSGTQLKKASDSTLVYQPSLAGNSSTLSYNTLQTPKGRQYSVVLPDGSKVWLNAASSLKYPTAFSGKERLVELTGEGYFEVVHNSKSPFRVKVGLETVEDIGTHFNINAYTDEPAVMTTLLEGSVRVITNQYRNVLQPGQQAVVSGGALRVQEADLNAAVSWKNGYFTFKKADIQTVMRQLARWYDVNVSYQGKISNVALTGDIYRNVQASQALKILSYFDIHYHIDGRTIVITE